MWKVPFYHENQVFNELLEIAFKKENHNQYKAETKEDKNLLIKKFLETTKQKIFLYINDKETEDLFKKSDLKEIISNLISEWKIDFKVVSSKNINFFNLDILVKKLIYETKINLKSFIVFDDKWYISWLWDNIVKWSNNESNCIFSVYDPEISKDLVNLTN